MGTKGRKMDAPITNEHIAKVGAGGHLDVLDDVAGYLASFDHAFFQHQLAVFEQDDVSASITKYADPLAGFASRSN